MLPTKGNMCQSGGQMVRRKTRLVGKVRGAGGSRTHFVTALQAVAVPSGSSAKSISVLARSRTWSSTFAGSRAIRNTPRTFLQRPAEESNLVRQFRGLPCDPAHPQGLLSKCLDQDSDLDLDLRRVLCDPLHHRDIQRPDLESNQVQSFRKALCDPLHHRDKPEPTTGFAPAWSGLQDRRLSQSSHVGDKQECKDLNPVGRLWRPLPLPGGHSCIGPRPCDRGPSA